MPNFKKLITEFFYYQTAKVVEIKNPWLGLLFYSIQLIILVWNFFIFNPSEWKKNKKLYVIGFVIIFNKEYQSTNSLVGSAVPKVKGNSKIQTNTGNVEIYDAYDVVYPPIENNALVYQFFFKFFFFQIFFSNFFPNFFFFFFASTSSLPLVLPKLKCSKEEPVLVMMVQRNALQTTTALLVNQQPMGSQMEHVILLLG